MGELVNVFLFDEQSGNSVEVRLSQTFADKATSGMLSFVFKLKI